MTLAGKLLVIFNLVFSAMMAVVALGLYATGLDYGPESKKDTTPKPPAQVTALAKEISDVVGTAAAIDGGWRSTRTELLKEEVQRTKNREVYDQELALLRVGPAAAKDQPVREVVFGADQLPVLDAASKLPMMKDAQDRSGQPLRPMAYYLAQIEAVRKENENLIANLEKQIKEDERLTTLLTGDKGVRGLRQMLVDERVKREGVLSEYNSVRPLFINTTVESLRTRRRFEELQEQIEQLRNYLRKIHKVDVAMGRR
jgi:hypothetical protein